MRGDLLRGLRENSMRPLGVYRSSSTEIVALCRKDALEQQNELQWHTSLLDGFLQMNKT